MTKEEQIEYFRTKIIKKYVDEIMENLNLKEEEKQNVRETN